MKFLVQDVICKNVEVPKSFDVTIFSNKIELESILSSSEKPPIVFCSTTLIRTVEKYNHISLFPSTYKSNDYRNPLFHNVWNSYIPSHMKLNWDYDYVTIQEILNHEYVTHLDRVFVRPNSPWKPFAGFDTKSENLDFELKCRMTLDHTEPHEIVVVSSYKKLDNIEWRCYSFEDEIIPVPYSWNDYDKSTTCPSEVLDFARTVFSKLEYLGNMWVIDIGYFHGKPYLIEVNAVSTSGWYAGLNVEKLFNAILNYTKE
jgi:hypothetical protein